MDVFALLFIVSFLALILTLAVMYIRKHIKVKDDVAKGSKHIGWVSEMLGRDDESTELRNDIKKEVNKTHEKGKKYE
jgi:hypothetical protein